MHTPTPDAAAIERAESLLAPFLRPTPWKRSRAINEEAQADVVFKLESQREEVNAFKIRGALFAVLSLDAAARAKGVATHSSGNHGKALGEAARGLGIPAYVVMPRNAPEVKKRLVAESGARIIECEPTQDAREGALDDVVQRTGATPIHPYDDDRIITGQATAAKEFLREHPDLDFLLAPVGGGGLLSGTALAAKYFSPHTRVLAGEPEGADDAFRSMQSGVLQGNAKPDTIADGLRMPLSERTFAIIKDNVERVIPVSDREIAHAMRILWERLRVIIEPSGAVGYAAVRKEPETFRGRKVGVIVTGGNVDLATAMEIFAAHPL